MASTSPFSVLSAKKCSVSHSVVSDPLRPLGLQPSRPLCPWASPGENSGVGCHSPSLTRSPIFPDLDSLPAPFQLPQLCGPPSTAAAAGLQVPTLPQPQPSPGSRKRLQLKFPGAPTAQGSCSQCVHLLRSSAVCEQDTDAPETHPAHVVRLLPHVPGNTSHSPGRPGEEVLVAQSCLALRNPMNCVAHQTPLSMGLSRQEYWSGLPFPSPGDLPDSGIEPSYPVSPALQEDYLPSEPPRKEDPCT